MSHSTTQSDLVLKTKPRLWPWVLLALVVCLAAISRQSLWIDETLTADKASQPTLQTWWHRIFLDKASDAQMPLYMIYIWTWVKIAGTSEWALRAANIPWFVAGVAALMEALAGARKFALALVVLLSPFAWYYLDEARPYAMQCGMSLMIFAALYRLNREEDLSSGEGRKWFAVFLFGVVALSGSSLLGMIWAGAACLCVPALFSRKQIMELLRNRWLISLLAVILLAAMGVYYLWTLKGGARASYVGKTDARNLLFIAYELLGFSGLGPGRLQMRSGGPGFFAAYAIPLMIYALLILDLLVLGGRQIYKSWNEKIRFGLLLAIALPIVTLLMAGYVDQFRVLGRHFAPFLSVALFVLSLGLEAQWNRGRWTSKLLVCVFVILSFISCLSFRFAVRHKKDDYRGAALEAKGAIAGGRTVWWDAGREGALYYRVPIAERPETRHAVLLANPTTEVLASLPTPEVIIMSKPEIYDVMQTVRQYLHEKKYLMTNTLPAFTVWQLQAGK